MSTANMGNITDNSGNVATGSNINQTIITLKSGQRVERLFMAPNLPPYAIVGRDDLLADLRARAFAGSSVALSTHGIGGVGKTALATLLAWDDAVLQHFSGGVLWASLGPPPPAGYPDTALDSALATLITALLGPEVPLASLNTAQRLATVKAGLAMRPFLIVFDDVWQPDHAATLRHLASPGCALLLTTRQQDTATEFSAAAINLAPLDEQQAVDLLTALSPTTAPYRDALTKIARAVGGLPLALTLVGGYLHDKVMFKPQADPALAAIQQVENWLGLSDKQRHLRFEQVLALSLAALPDDAHRAAFLHLAAFAAKPASFSLAAACAVSQLAANAPDLDLIATLVRRNLLERVSDERFTIHPTLHALAHARCADLPAARRAHADFYLKLMNADPDDWQAIEPEWEQIQPAWAWVSATPQAEDMVISYISASQTFQIIRGYWRERLIWLQSGLELARKLANQDDEAWLLGNLGWVHSSLGENPQALTYFQQALPIMQQVGDRAGEAATFTNIGGVYNNLGENPQALAYYQQALPIMRQVGNHAGEAAILNNIGGVYKSLGDQPQSLAYIQQALPIRRQVGDRAGEAVTLNDIGVVYQSLGDQWQALAYYQQALPIMRQVGNRAGEATTLNNIGLVYNALGDQRQALAYYQQALPISRQIGDRANESRLLNNIGYIYLDEDDLAQARTYLGQALALGEQVQYPALIAAARRGLEEVRRRGGLANGL